MPVIGVKNKPFKPFPQPLILHTYIGVDPGATGGLAVVSELGDKVTVTSVKMPDSERETLGWFQLLTFCGRTDRITYTALIEKVGGFMGKKSEEGNGFNKASGHTMFTFGWGYGNLRTSMLACGIPFEEVVPITWQKEFVPKKPKGDSKSDHKNRLKAVAQQLYPDQKVTLATSDAILIATYCMRKAKGTLKMNGSK